MNNFEEFNKNKELEKCESDYFNTVHDFLDKHKFVEIKNYSNDVLKDKDYKIYKSEDWRNVDKNKFKNEKKQMSEFLQTPEFLKDFFEREGFKNIPPKSIINKDSSTLFIDRK